jgi:hypothetical protein
VTSCSIARPFIQSASASPAVASRAQAVATISRRSGLEFVQRGARHQRLAGAVRLVEARPQIMGRGAMKAERHVGEGAEKLHRLDHALLQRGQDFGRRNRLRVHAEAAKHLGAEAGGADRDPAQILQRADRIPEPAAHLEAGIAGHVRLDAMGRVEFVPQFLPAAMLDPGDMLGRREPERHRGEEHRRRHLALPEERGGMADLRRAGGNRVEHLEGRHQLAGGIEIDGQPPAAHVADTLGHAGGADAGPRQIGRPGRDHAPLRQVARQGRTRQRRRTRRRNSADQRLAPGDREVMCGSPSCLGHMAWK